MVRSISKGLLVFLFLLMQQPVRAFSSEQDELNRIRHNYKKMLVPMQGDSSELLSLLEAITPEEEVSDQVVAELHQRYPFDLDKIELYLSQMQEDGSWSDINYQDSKRSGWDPKRHAERILELVKLYESDKTPYYRSAEIEAHIHKALNYWFEAKLVCLNWWYNQIGVPKTLGSAFILFEDKLTAGERKSAIEVMENAKFGMTGQNKVWLAGNVMVRALLQNDYQLVKMARDTIVSEITTGGEEGIKSDWSFHQHGAQQQFGNYGLSFVSGMSFFSGVFDGTSMAFDQQHLTILNSLIQYGYRWTLWRGMMDISALGRQLFHNAPLHKGLALLFAASALNSGELTEFTGHKHFWDSDYTIYRRPQWMASVKMASQRVIGTESMNGDNMKGYYMADGAMYVYGNDKKYLNIFPFWDWRKIPGVTAYNQDAPMPVVKRYEPRNQALFVGGVTDGQCGMSAMELNRDGLQARKAWIFADDLILCLGAGISTDTLLPVTTSVEQCYPQGDFLYLNRGQWNKIEGTQTFTDREQRFSLGNTGYIIWGRSDAVESVAGLSKRTGRWHDIMQMYQPKEVQSEVASLYLAHGMTPTHEKYQYLILPAASKEEVACFDLADWQVLRNDETAQAVYSHAHNSLWITAYQPVELSANGMKVNIKTPGIYMVKMDSMPYHIWYSDPTRQLNTVEMTIHNITIKNSAKGLSTGESYLIYPD